MSNYDPAEHEVYEPTPEEIRAACEAIQAEWSPEDFLRRRGKLPDAAYEIPEVRVSRTA